MRCVVASLPSSGKRMKDATALCLDKPGQSPTMARSGFDRFHGIDLPGTVTPFALATFASASLFRRMCVPASGLILLATGTT
jgi:hypothetical protein